MPKLYRGAIEATIVDADPSIPKNGLFGIQVRGEDGQTYGEFIGFEKGEEERALRALVQRLSHYEWDELP